MADYAGTLGLTYDIPRNQMQPASGIDPFSMQQMEQMQQRGPAISKPEQGLYEVEGLTKEYYDKWSAVNEFAQNMWSQGIDITKPDPFNPQSQAAHRWYLKALADLERHGNALKNSQKTLESYTTAKLSERGQDIGFTDSFDSSKDLLSPFDLVNRRDSDMVTNVNTRLAKSTSDPAEMQALQSQIDEKARVLKTQLADMLIGGANEAQIAEKVNEINSLNRATYDSTARWKEGQENARAKARLEADQKPIDYTRVELVQRVLNGDYDLLKANPKIKSVEAINTPRRKGIMVTAQGLDQPKFIDLSGADPGKLNDINEMLNYGQEGKAVSTDDFTRLLKTYPSKISYPTMEDTTEAEANFLSALGSEGEFRTKTAAQQALRDARPNLQIPTSVSGLDYNYYVKALDFDDTEVEFTLQDDKNEQKGKITLDLKKPADAKKFQQIIDANPTLFNLSIFKPKPQALKDTKPYIPAEYKTGTKVDNNTALIELL